ncbi:hypothetical protein [Virgibacillus pantothenticus]|uniref:hypothetical protein n=1 Tax=Virgibacillus pantothenticus TaxID=1473 RepID=UPI000985148A|nr:hypothetical protein [Virgibacillus pantothenticus]
MGTNKQYHIQGKKGSYFRDQLRGVDLEQVLIIAIDAAKLHQKALICNYFGDVIEKPFFFSVNHPGIDLLCAKIEKAIKMVGAQRIFSGVEATGHYYEDIVRELGARVIVWISSMPIPPKKREIVLLIGVKRTI